MLISPHQLHDFICLALRFGYICKLAQIVFGTRLGGKKERKKGDRDTDGQTRQTDQNKKEREQ